MAQAAKTARKPAARAVPAKAVPAGLVLSIDGPDSVPPGKLVKLDASATDADVFRWLLVGGASELYDVAGDGRLVYFATATPGAYTFVLSAAKTAEGGPLLEQLEHVVTVEKPEEEPEPPTKPTPPTVPAPQPPAPPTVPAPTPPVTIPDLVLWSQTTAVALVPADAQRGAVATALALTLRTWAGKANNFSQPQEFIRGSNMVLDVVLGQLNAKASWKPWRDALEKKLATLGLTTVAQHAAAWQEIAQGLELVK